MNNEYRRSFTFMVPSTLLLDWRYEFHCSIEILEARRIVVDLQEDTVGSVQIKVRNPGTRWKIWLYIWEQCHILALNHAFAQNTQDDEHLSPRYVQWPIVQE